MWNIPAVCAGCCSGCASWSARGLAEMFSWRSARQGLCWEGCKARAPGLGVCLLGISLCFLLSSLLLCAQVETAAAQPRLPRRLFAVRHQMPACEAIAITSAYSSWATWVTRDHSQSQLCWNLRPTLPVGSVNDCLLVMALIIKTGLVALLSCSCVTFQILKN